VEFCWPFVCLTNLGKQKQELREFIFEFVRLPRSYGEDILKHIKTGQVSKYVCLFHQVEKVCLKELIGLNHIQLKNMGLPWGLASHLKGACLLSWQSSWYWMRWKACLNLPFCSCNFTFFHQFCQSLFLVFLSFLFFFCFCNQCSLCSDSIEQLRGSPHGIFSPVFVESRPYQWPFNGNLTVDNTALIIIDMQKESKLGVKICVLIWIYFDLDLF
jgi:hypothetical protein